MSARLLAPALVLPALRPKHLVPKAPDSSPDNVVQLRSPIKKAGRLRSRELLQQALAETKCDDGVIAEATDVNVRGGARAITGEKPFDIGDILCLASTGRAGARAALRLTDLLTAEINRIQFSGHE